MSIVTEQLFHLLYNRVSLDGLLPQAATKLGEKA
jgi:hypothetical protein